MDFVAASTDPFATQGAVYRRPIDRNGPLQPLGGGMPKWIDGIRNVADFDDCGIDLVNPWDGS
jgi:hypothetical protein